MREFAATVGVVLGMIILLLLLRSRRLYWRAAAVLDGWLADHQPGHHTYRNQRIQEKKRETR